MFPNSRSEFDLKYTCVLLQLYFAGLCISLGSCFADKPHNPMVNAGAIVCTSLIKVKTECLFTHVCRFLVCG